MPTMVIALPADVMSSAVRIEDEEIVTATSLFMEDRLWTRVYWNRGMAMMTCMEGRYRPHRLVRIVGRVKEALFHECA